MTTADEAVQELGFIIRDGVNGEDLFLGKPMKKHKARATCPARSKDTEEVATITVGGRRFVVQVWEVE